MSSDILERSESYSTDINDTIATAVGKVSYNGDVTIADIDAFNPMVLSYNNSAALCDYLAANEYYEKYNENSRAELVDIGEDNLKHERITEALFVAAECIIGVASIACGGVGILVDGAITAAVGIAIDVGMAVAEGLLSEGSLWSKDTNNCIAITQNANYGTVSGHGIAGYTNDRVRFLYCHSAANTNDGYTVTNNKHDGMKVEYIIASGEPSADAYSGYGTGHNTIIDYSHAYFNESADFGDSGNYDNHPLEYDFFDGGYWKLNSGYAFPLINNSRYIDDWGGSLK